MDYLSNILNNLSSNKSLNEVYIFLSALFYIYLIRRFRIGLNILFSDDRYSYFLLFSLPLLGVLFYAFVIGYKDYAILGIVLFIIGLGYIYTLYKFIKKLNDKRKSN